MNSAIYEGKIRHRRFSERRHEFSYRLSMAYVDLDEVGELLGGRLVRRWPGVARFRRSDYLGDPSVPLAEAVRDVVRRDRGSAPAGPIRVLTQLRMFGHCFNPVSFYYCFAEDGVTLGAIVAEVTNTPWGERHAYVLEGGDDLPKLMHVSPFMGMRQRYAFKAPAPGQTLSVHIESSEQGKRVFDATLGMRRRPFSARTMSRIVARHPAATLRILALIYSHALVIRLKGVRVKPHPKTQTQ